MIAVNCAQMRAIEESAFQQGWSAEQLMEQVGEKIALQIMAEYQQQAVCAFIGKGNNGGDALVALRHLRAAGWAVQVRMPKGLNFLQFSGLARRKLRELGEECLVEHCTALLLLDGLLGIGAEGALRSPLLELAEEMNALREDYHAEVIAIDIPSGINADSGEVSAGAVKADLTLTVAVPKFGLLESQAVNSVGRLRCLPIDALAAPDTGERALISPPPLPKRDFDFHKGMAGSVGIWAGSRGMLGAAALCAEAALRSGAGLVTLYTSEALYPLLCSMVRNEVMVKPVMDFHCLLENGHDALAVGPGLGKEVDVEVLEDIIGGAKVPIVVDADALNCLAENAAQSCLTARCICTPHPGEMRRWMKGSETLTREQVAQHYSETYSGTLVYKGARTIVTNGELPLWFNGTGTPAMATAGQGDVLTGAIAGLCAQGLSPLEAAKNAVAACGLASETAVKSTGIHGLTAGDTLAEIGGILG